VCDDVASPFHSAGPFISIQHSKVKFSSHHRGKNAFQNCLPRCRLRLLGYVYVQTAVTRQLQPLICTAHMHRGTIYAPGFALHVHAQGDPPGGSNGTRGGGDGSGGGDWSTEVASSNGASLSGGAVAAIVAGSVVGAVLVAVVAALVVVRVSQGRVVGAVKESALP